MTVPDEIEREIAGNGQMRGFEAIELTGQVSDLGPDRQSGRDEPAGSHPNRGEVIPDLVDEAAAPNDNFNDRRGLFLRECGLRWYAQHRDNGQSDPGATSHMHSPRECAKDSRRSSRITGAADTNRELRSDHAPDRRCMFELPR
jgi:hypothetical protein